EKTEVNHEEDSKKITQALEKAAWTVRSVEKKERRRNPAAPFTTSKFQQDVSRKLRFTVKRAMGLAQRLYEGVELGTEGQVGLITYMRTDSVRCSQDAIGEARANRQQCYAPKHVPDTQQHQSFTQELRIPCQC